MAYFTNENLITSVFLRIPQQMSDVNINMKLCSDFSCFIPIFNYYNLDIITLINETLPSHMIV